MLEKYAFQKACKLLSYRIHYGRCGAVYMGGHQVLATTVKGDTVLLDSRHFPSLKLCHLPSSKEIALLCLLDLVIHPLMRCADIGAGCGYYSLVLASLVGEKGKVFSFEHNAEYFKLLKSNISSNGYVTVDCVNSSSALDAYLSAKEQIDFVHVSPEEDLPTTFEGMKQLVASNPSLAILCHIDPELLRQHPDKFDSLFLELHEAGFEAILVPSLELLASKEQLTHDRSVKSLYLSRLSYD